MKILHLKPLHLPDEQENPETDETFGIHFADTPSEALPITVEIGDHTYVTDENGDVTIDVPVGTYHWTATTQENKMMGGDFEVTAEMYGRVITYNYGSITWVQL